MTETIDDLKAFIHVQLSANCDAVLPKTANGKEKRLSVWTTQTRRRPIGVELGHPGIVNLWIVSINAPTSVPTSVSIVQKVWKGSGWQDKDPDPKKKGRDGANSNLKPFEVFNTRPITRLGVRSIDDARVIFEHLLA